MAFLNPDFSGTEAQQERSRVVVPRAAAWPQHLNNSPDPPIWPTKVESKAQLACPSALSLMPIMLTWGQNSFLYIKKPPSPYMALSYLISFYKNLCSKMNAADVYSSEKRLCFEATQ